MKLLTRTWRRSWPDPALILRDPFAGLGPFVGRTPFWRRWSLPGLTIRPISGGVANGFIYTAKNGDAGAAISTAITILQIKAGAAALDILRATVTQGLSETSTQEQAEIVRKSAAATVTSFTPRKFNPNAPAALAVGGTAATGYTGTAEGTDTDILIDEGWNILNGWIWVPTEAERMDVDQTGIIASKFQVAPASATWRAAFTIREWR